MRAWDHIGLHRRKSLALGLETSDAPLILCADPEHILRWAERAPDELDKVLSMLGSCDCLVGRSKAAFRAAPARLRATESVVNHIYRLMTGNTWNLMIAAQRWDGFYRSAV